LTENFNTQEYKRFIGFCYPTPADWKQLYSVNREYCVLFIKAGYPVADSATGKLTMFLKTKPLHPANSDLTSVILPSNQ